MSEPTDETLRAMCATYERADGKTRYDAVISEDMRAVFEVCRTVLAREQEADALDAARYRWLRDHMWEQALSKVYALPILWGVDYPGEAGKKMDDVIDEAIRARSADANGGE